ncbi:MULTISPECIES: AMP-binding protein [unclassified Mycobacterium]|uniref:AMP-binding protein n=1 Tax=unclassified Mycobacterium TaxID=2642494 RepID=UPI0029C83C0C|nr:MULTISPECIES: AMP-binding protein [unclassified Mycobacterium]
MFVPLTVGDFLDRAELVYGDRVAIADEPDQPASSLGAITYREMARYARAQAARLDELGLRPGERVAVLSHNSARMMISFFGISGWGRVMVPINFRLTAPEIAYVVQHSGADLLCIDPEFEDVVAGLKTRRVIVFGDDDALYRPGVEPQQWADVDENAIASLNYTSGTTSRPKGVQLTHRNLWLNAAVFGLHLGLSDRDVVLHTLPMFHANGWGMPYAATGVGAGHVVLRQVDGAEILRRVAQYDVTVMCGAPTVVDRILEAAATWPGPLPGRGRVRIVVAGAPPPTRTIERVLDVLGWEFIQIYGLTETSPLLTINRQRREWDSLSVSGRARLLGRAGAPALGVRLTTAPDDEVLARSNHNLFGYWQQPDATAEAIRDDWFHTGDRGEVGADGYLTIADRKKDVIITGGENVSSVEVEDVLTSHPAVREAAVIAIPHETWGEAVHALVVTDGSNVTEEELIAHCRASLAGYKAPKRVEFRSELARTATGKLQKFKLRIPYWTDTHGI